MLTVVNAALVILGLALLFYLVHRMHGQVGGCRDGHPHGDEPGPGGGGEDSPRPPVGAGFAAMLVVTLIFLLPLMLLHAATPAGSPLHPVLFWITLLLPFLAIPLVRAAGRLHGIKVTLPYFIPVPMGLGTFGAFIQIRGAIPDRRKLFDVGVAGPLAGLVIALPALYFGLKGVTATASGPGIALSSSVLLAWLYALSNGAPVRPDHLVMLSPVGFAGWLGLLVTALNLIPVGQLDGGHVAYALFGRRRAETLGWVAFFLLVALGIFYWSGWLTWAILIFLLGGMKHEPALNEVPQPGWRRRTIGALAFALLFLIMAPVPHRFMTALGILCPYL